MEPFEDLSGKGHDIRTAGEVEDSNALILPKKNKNNKQKSKNRGHEALHTTNCPKLSKSQKRKLKKLEEEKEKAILLMKSIETLEKYKIREDAYSLMWSSRNLGQVESVREKRRREMQFSKAGLELQRTDPHRKRKKAGDTYAEVECAVDIPGSDCATQFVQLPLAEIEIKSDPSSGLEFSQELDVREAFNNSSGDSDVQIKEVADKIFEPSEPESLRSTLSMHHSNGEEMENSEMDKLDEKSESNPSSRKCQDASPPQVVHVSRPKEVESKRMDLPIVMMEQEIMEAINENSCVIICGETGCGKTTQVPQFLYEAGFGSSHSESRGGIIGVTQPRRVAVLATAKRVAFELGECLGKGVGFQVRHDRKIGDNCSIKFMTDGILLRELQTDFLLRRYSIIILDEAHERSLNTDILIGMLSRIVQERQWEYEQQQKRVLLGEVINPENRIYPLKLVLMSATLRVEDFVSGRRIFRDTPPVIEVPTRQYPVTIHFSKRTEIVDYIGQAYKKILSIHKRLPPGGILVFVTGQREVEYLCRKLRKASMEIVKKVRGEKNESLSSSIEYSHDENNGEEIDEAFEIEGNASHEITDRFSAHDGDDYCDASDDESDLSYESEDDSDLEVSGDDEDLLNQKPAESCGNPADVLGDDDIFFSLKAAFESLADKKPVDHDSAGVAVPLVPEAAADQVDLPKRVVKSNDVCPGPLCVLPLYAMLPASSQLRVFEDINEGERLVVVATNVAETSLTIPGIKYVVDTGREKVKNYNSSNGMEAYEIQWISKASAAQRAGRAGRTGPGHCYRLYSSAVFNNIFSDFSTAEISKVPVDGVVLLMKSMHIDKVSNFPFPTPPEATAIAEAERCLKILEALDSKGRLTPIGRAMAQYPMSPRHSRMLLTVLQIMQNLRGYGRANLILGYAVAAAAALSLSNPFMMQFDGVHNEVDSSNQVKKTDLAETEKFTDKEEKMRKKKLKESAKMSRSKFSNPTSDALTIAYALQCFELSEDPVKFCSDNLLHFKTMEEMSKLRKQLLQLVFSSNLQNGMQEFSWAHGVIKDVECAWKIAYDKHPLLLKEEEILGQAICAGWADRVAKRIKGSSVLHEGERKVNSVRYQACMLKETVFLHLRSSVSKSAPEFLVYSELLHTKRPYIHGATSVKSNWLVKYARPLCTFSAPLPDPKPYYDPRSDEVLCWVIPTFGPHLWQLPLHAVPIENDINRVAVFAYSLLDGQVLPCLKSVRKFMAAPPASILRPEACGLKRVGNLLNKLRTRLRIIDSCAMLRKLWEDSPRELYMEILDWFQEGFKKQFKDLWSEMQREILLEPRERFTKKVKRIKGKI